jgi:hypothetical protein
MFWPWRYLGAVPIVGWGVAPDTVPTATGVKGVGWVTPMAAVAGGWLGAAVAVDGWEAAPATGPACVGTGVWDWSVAVAAVGGRAGGVLP